MLVMWASLGASRRRLRRRHQPVDDGL